MESLWVRDFSQLMTQPLQIWPTAEMTSEQRYNAMTRFLIWYCVLVAIIRKQIEPVQVLLVILLVLVVLHELETPVHSNTPAHKSVVTTVNRESPKPRPAFEAFPVQQDPRTIPAPPLQTGSMFAEDSDSCKPPTVQNPYMNQLIGEPMHVQPCDGVSSKQMDQLMTHQLPVDDWDIMRKANSQRQFYTVPCQSGTCDTTQFANFLYNTPFTA